MTEAPFGTAGLVGRDAEMRRLTALLDAGGDAALVLTGEAGVGKTALLDAAAQRAAARGVRVVRGSGSEYETEIGFAGLHQLVGELGEEFHALPRTARDALGVALGLLDGAAPSRIAVMNAALTLFRQVASVQPLLLVVDDLHVLDDASRAALGFVGRRLTGSRIALLGARRTGPVARSFALGLEELDLAPLAEADALTLLSRRFAHLPGRVRAELAMQAQGNPLALLEFAGSTTMAGAGREVAPAGGNGRGRDVRALFQERVERLPHATRELLLLLALEGSGDLPTLETASGHEGLDDLQPAERDRLVMVVDGGRVVRFRHPLVRSAVVEASTSAQRRRAHRRLALAVADPVRRGDHWARATTVPDDTVADIVEAASQVGLRRGDAEGAVARLRRAAARFLWGGEGFGGIVRDFGRPSVRTWLGGGLRPGPAYAEVPTTAVLATLPSPADVDPVTIARAAAERSEELNARPGVHSAAWLVDPATWAVTHVTLAGAEAPLDAWAARPHETFDVLHLSRPELGDLLEDRLDDRLGASR